MLKALISKIKKEIKKVCKLDHNSILWDDIEGVKQFSWETVWLKLQRNVPTLYSLRAKLLYQPSKPLIYFMISQMFTLYGLGSVGNFNFITWQWYQQADNCFMSHIAWYWHTYIVLCRCIAACSD